MRVKTPINFNVFAFFYFFLLTASTVYSQTANFNVQQIQDDVSNAGGTTSSFTSVSSLNNAFVLANNNRKTHGGSISSGGNMEGDDMSGARRLTATNTLTYYRASGSVNQDMRFNSSIWEYTGPSGGCNEFIVRGRYTVSLSGSTNSVTQSISGIVNANNCIPFITGIINNDTNDGADSSTSVAYLENTTTLRVQKGTNSNNVTVYVTLVEFTGSNWTVLHGDSGNVNGDTGTITLRDNSDGTGTTTNVSDWSESIIFSHFRADTAASGTNEAIEDLWPILDPGTNNNEIDWTFQGNGHLSNGTNRHFVHVLSNPFLSVNRIQNTSNTAGETTFTISPALTSINEAFIVGSSVSTGGGTAYGRGWRNYYLNTTTEAAHWAHRNGNGMSHEIQVVDLSGLNSQDIDVVDSGANAISDASANSPLAINSTEFGNVNIGSSLANTYTIENNGSCNLSISSITSSNSDFVVSSVPSSISGGSTGTFIVTYNPSTPAGTATSTITITNNDSDASEQSYTFTVQGTGVVPTVTYCASSGSNNFYLYMNRVELNTIDNTPTGNGVGTPTLGYTDYTSVSTDLTQESTYTIDLTPYKRANYLVGYSVWIDYNNDGDFLDSGEQILSSLTDSYSPSASFTVPVTAALGSTRMRVSMKYDDVPDSCESFTYGEVEDYTVNIISSSPQPEIDIFGNSVEITNGDAIPDTSDDTDFGSVSSGSTVDHTFTISNTGTATLNLDGSPLVSISGGEFSVLTQPSSNTIASSNSLTFVVRFSPTFNGTQSATISIENNDASEDPYTFVVQGNGIAALTQGPGGVTSNLQLWLKSNDGVTYNGSNGVTNWATRGRGSDATVNTAGQEPTFYNNATQNINFNPVIDFDNTPGSPESSDYTYLPQEYLAGGSGFYTQDIFMVLIPNIEVSNTTAPMDVFCGDDIATSSKDVTGIGYGDYSERFNDSNEVLSYCVSSTSGSDPQPAHDDRGYGIAHISDVDTYSTAGIINSRNNSSINGQEFYFNGLNIGDFEVGINNFFNINNSKYWIGRSEGYTASTDARIAELITYDSRKDDGTERRKIESYLGIKYGITLADSGTGTTQDYVDSDGNIIWDATADSGAFNFDIAGIGRDDDSGLSQKQSKSINSSSVVTIGHKEISTTNSSNSNSFTTDKDFLVWGHNNGPLSGTNTISVNLGAPSISVTTVFDRKWRIQENRPSTSNDILDVRISLPSTTLPSISSTEEYALIVSSTSSFGSGDIVDVIPLTLNGSNYETWYDFDNVKYFTFGVASRLTGKYKVNFSTGDFLVGEDFVDLNSTYSVSSWVRNLGNGGTYISKGNAYDFRINASGNVEVSINGSTRITSSQVINDSKWHHIAATFSGGTLALYIDGVEDENSPAGSVSNPSATTDKFAIGVVYTDKNTISTPFNGDIDEIRVWDIALTQAQIQYIMNQEIENLSTNVNGSILPQSTTLNQVASIPWSNVRAYHNINSFYGTTVEDGSGHNNWVRIKYLTVNKNIIYNQSAPLPYVSTNNGSWDLETTWENGSELIIPNTTSLDGSTVVDWNIVETTTNVNTTRNVKVLGLNNSANELSINNANYLEVSHYLKIDGVLDLDGESQLIQTIDSDFDDTSAGYLERDQQGEGNRFRYNDWSSPVYTQIDSDTSINGTGKYTTVSASLRDGTNPSSPGTINYTSGYSGSTSPLTLSTYWMYKYTDSPDGDYSSWIQAGNTGKIYAGEGFLMKGAGDPGDAEQNYVFQGKPNNGTIQLSVSANYDYLIGNPYPSAIDAIQFINDNPGINGGSLYFWEHYGGNSHNLADYQAGYATINLFGASTPASSHLPSGVSSAGTSVKTLKRYIPVGQGFFFWAGGSNTTIEFNNGQRIFKTEASGESVFMKGTNTKTSKTATTVDTRPIIRIGFDAPEIDHRQLIIGADEKATDNVDWGYDAVIYETLDDDMYWIINNNKYVIQGINSINSETELPIGVQSKKGGIISIKIEELINTPDDLEVYVLDKTTNTTFDIKNEAFETVLNANATYTNRYSIVFKQNEVLGVNEEILDQNLLVYVNNSEKNLIIKNNTDFEIEGVSLYNYLGQCIQQWNLKFDEEKLTLPVKNNQGVYIVKILTSKGILSKKIIIE